MPSIFLYIVHGVGYGLAAALQPGPFQTYLISQSLDHGWRKTMPATLAPLLSDGPIIALTLFILSQVPKWLVRGLYLAGGTFILYLATQTFRRWRHFDLEKDGIPARSGQQNLIRAVLMNALSPGPYIYWSLVTGPILLAGWHQSAAHGAGFLAGFYTAMLASLGSLILVFGMARQANPRFNRTLLGISGIALAAFGVYHLWLGIKGG